MARARATIGLLLAQYPVVGYLVWTGFFHPVMLVILLSAYSLPRVFQVFRYPRPERAPKEFPEGVWPLYFVGIAFWFTRRYGAFFLVGLVLDVALS